MIKKIFFTGLLLHVLLVAYAQPFVNEIAAFKKKDSISFPPQKAILFVGSSSFTRWTDVQDYFPGFTIINRGFGGSSLSDVIRYENDILFSYEPKQIIIYCGENDFAFSDTVAVITVVDRFKQLFIDIRKRLPKVAVAYISMKPSPSRVQLMSKMLRANLAIKNYLKEKKKTAYIDVYTKMLDKDGKPLSDIFLSDNLHMNKKGYNLWQKIIEPYLLKL